MKNLKEPLDRNVVITGFTSFFTDVSSEMVYPLLQGFISAVMRGQAAMLGPVLGIIEGIAESTASLLKVFSGYWSDKKQSRKSPTILGYSISALSRLLLFMPLWYTILAARFLDKAGKGIRTAPRDALISESTPLQQQGRSFGFQRGMDFAGALLGTVILFFLVRYVFPDADRMQEPSSFYPLFAVALVPAFIGVFCLFLVREKDKERREPDRQRPSFNLKNYPGNLRIFFLSQFIFTLGNSSNQFLLLRSTNLGYALSSVIVMYMIFNFTTSLLSTPFGALSDRLGRKRILLGGYSLYAAVYMAFGFISTPGSLLLWIFWPLYGIYYAMTEGVEKAFVADTAPAGSKGTALGFYNTIVGIGLLPASIIAGFLFAWIPSAPFVFGGMMAVLTVAIIGFFIREH